MFMQTLTSNKRQNLLKKGKLSSRVDWLKRITGSQCLLTLSIPWASAGRKWRYYAVENQGVLSMKKAAPISRCLQNQFYCGVWAKESWCGCSFILSCKSNRYWWTLLTSIKMNDILSTETVSYCRRKKQPQLKLPMYIKQSITPLYLLIIQMQCLAEDNLSSRNQLWRGYSNYLNQDECRFA